MYRNFENVNERINTQDGLSRKISIVNVSVGYDIKFSIIQNLNATFSQGDFIVLLGRNGQGKSTLLKTIVSILKPISGEIKSNIPIKSFLQSVAYVPSTIEIHGYITVYEYISYGRYQHTNYMGTLKENDKVAINKAIIMLGIEELQNRLFSTLSDGEKQKCHIARAIAQEPLFLILDEPTSHLDLPMKRTILKILHTISEHNIGILLSTHDIHTIMEISKTIWFVENQECFIVNENQNYPLELQRFFDDSGIKKA